MRDALRREIERDEQEATGVLLDVIASTGGRSGDDYTPAKQHIACMLIAFEAIVVTPEIINRAVDGPVRWQVSVPGNDTAGSASNTRS